MWSERRVSVTRLATAFSTDCNRFTNPSEMPKIKELRVAVVQATGDERLYVLLASSDRQYSACLIHDATLSIPIVKFLALDSMRAICYRPSVCPTHGWINRKRLKLGLCNFHHTVAPSL